MTDLADVLRRVVDALKAAKVPFMIAGSLASTTHGLPRTTQDLDVVIDPLDLAALESLVREFPPAAYYADIDAARDAFRRRAMFNVVDHASGWKIDFILRKDRPYSREEFARRRPVSLLGVDVFMASPEDTILSKLEWSRISGGSERQRRDVAGIVAALGEELDRPYLELWASVLGVEDEWKLLSG
jgi:hypothetical protein